MSGNIVSYKLGYNQYYYEYKEKNPDYVPEASGCSGCSGASNVSGASGASGTSGAGGCSGASGGTFDNTSMEYIYTSIGSVEDLNVHQLIDLFVKGNLEVSELDRWLDKNKYIVHNLSKTVDGGMIKYKFNYLNVDYTIACTEKAAKSQFDTVRQNNYSVEYLKNTYGFTQDELDEYFTISYSSHYDNKTTYVINPACGSLSKLKEHLKKLKEFEKNIENNYLPYRTGDDFMDDYSALIKADLKMKYGYSDGFIDGLIKSARSYAFFKGGNLQDMAANFKKTIEDLQNTPKLTYDSKFYFGPGKSDYTTENLWSERGISISSIYNYISNQGASCEWTERHFCSMFFDVFNTLNLDISERESLVKVVFNEVAKKLGISRDEYGEVRITIADLEKLDKNGQSSFLDELYNIIQNNAAKTVHIDSSVVDNATKIDGIEFFNIIHTKQGCFDAEELLNNLDKMLLSKDPGIRKFTLMINDMFASLKDVKPRGCYSYEDKLRACQYLIMLINDQCGVTNTNPPKLHHLTFGKFAQNNSNIFDAIKNITESTAFNNLYAANVDGVIGKFVQGDVGDCWFLSAILSLNATLSGQTIIKNAIKWNSDYTGFIVSFAGIEEKIEVSLDELLSSDPNLNPEARYGGDGLSFGDNDVLLLEIAYKKLKGRINGSSSGSAHSANVQDAWDFIFDTSNARTSRSFWKLFIPNCSTDKHTCSGVDDVIGGVGGLLGIGDGVLDMDRSTVYSSLRELLSYKAAGKRFAATFSLLASDGHTYTCNTVDGGKPFKCNTHGHTIAITDITSSTVTFTDTDCKSYTVTWSDFAGMGIARIEWATWP